MAGCPNHDADQNTGRELPPLEHSAGPGSNEPDVSAKPAKIRVRAIYEWEIDPAAYVAAGIEADWLIEGEDDPTDLTMIAQLATGYTDPENDLPRWARDAMRVVSQTVEVIA